MSLLSEDYNYFCNALVNNNCNISRNDLNSLKDEYKSKINSNRRLECTKNMSDLIKILEKRGCLSKDNISDLYAIARILNQPYLTSQFLIRVNRLDLNSKHIQSLYSETVTCAELVCNEICTKLGKSWIEFARVLHVQECKIDELKIKYAEHRRYCIKEILGYLKNNTNNENHYFYEIKKALTKARRNDLRKSVENILKNY